MIYLILLLGLGLRLISLNQSLWLDEATSALVAQMAHKVIISDFTVNDFHPPLYYLILRDWSLGLSASEIGLRSLSVFAGLATVWLVYKIILQINKNEGVAGTAAVLLATSGLHIYFSQEARMYVLASFFVALAVYSFARLQAPGAQATGGQVKNHIGWVEYGLAIAAATLTHYLTLFTLPIFWLTAKKSKKFYTSHIILTVAWLAWLPHFAKQLTGGLNVAGSSPAWWNILGKTSIKEIALIPTKFILGRISFDNKLLYAAVAVSVIALFGYLLIKAFSKFKDYKLIWLWLIIPTALAALVGLFIPVFSYFRLLFVLPAFYILVAVGIFESKPAMRKGFLILIISINLISSGVYLLNPKFHREDWRGLVSFVESQKTDNSITIFPADSQMEAYTYYAKEANIAGPEAIGDGYDQIWLMRYVQDVFDPQDNTRKQIEDLDYQKQMEYDFNGVVVWEYEK